jgi:hypothetical protein
VLVRRAPRSAPAHAAQPRRAHDRAHDRAQRAGRSTPAAAAQLGPRVREPTPTVHLPRTARRAVFRPRRLYSPRPRPPPRQHSCRSHAPPGVQPLSSSCGSPEPACAASSLYLAASPRRRAELAPFLSLPRLSSPFSVSAWHSPAMARARLSRLGRPHLSSPSPASLAPCAQRPSRRALVTPSPIPMPLATVVLLERPNRAQASEPPHAQHPVPDRSWPPWLAKVAEPPSLTPLTSLQPAQAVRLPSPRLRLAVSRDVHVKSRVHSASPCSRSRRRATSARTRVRLRAVRRRDSVHARLPSSTPCLPLVYPSSTPHVHSRRSPSPAHRALNRRVPFARVVRAVRTHRRALLCTLIVRLT